MSQMSKQMTLEGQELLSARIHKASDIIRRVKENSQLPLIVNFSGGRDSQVLLDLVQQVTSDFFCFYMVSGIDWKESLQHVENICREYDAKLMVSHPQDYSSCWSVRVNGFFERLERFGYWPTVKKQWCSIYLKIRPQRQVLRRVFGVKLRRKSGKWKPQSIFKLNGVRREESSRRMQIYRRLAKSGYMVKDPNQPEAMMVFPILDWTDKDVNDYLLLRGMKRKENPLYSKFGVSGCYYCPFFEPEIYRRIASEDPGLYDRFIEYERKLDRPAVIGNVWLRDIMER